MRIPKITYEQAKQLYVDGFSISEIEKQYDYERHKLSKQLKSDNTTVKKDGTKYSIDEHFFDTIDSEEKAYWLGVLYSDGYVGIDLERGRYVVELALAEDDKELVEKFRDAICKDKPILFKKKFRQNDKNKYRAYFDNKHLVTTLVSKGCTPKKSLTVKFPTEEIVPNPLIRHFIRGVFDGDGSIYFSQGQIHFNICSGSREFIEVLKRKLEEGIEGCKFSKVNEDIREGRSTLFYIRKGGKKEPMKVFNYLYENATIYMQRKYGKYLEAKKVVPSETEMTQIIRAELSVEAVTP